MQLCLGQLNCKTAVKIRLACYSKKKLQLMWSCSYVFRLSCKIVLSVDATVLVCTADQFPGHRTELGETVLQTEYNI